MHRSGADIHRSEKQSKVIQDRITSIEQHLGQLCDISSSYTRKTAKLRDKGFFNRDALAKELMEYSEYEKWNPTLSNGMAKFAENVSAVQDYRDAEVKRLEGKIITPLVNYGLLCKQTRNDMKAAFADREREQAQKKKLEVAKAKNAGDRQKIILFSFTFAQAQLETELQRASIDASRSSKNLEQQIDNFEGKKLKDLKKLMREFVTIEMHFHAKALETYTQCFQYLENVDPEADLDEFRHQLRPNGSIRSDMARSASQASLDSRQNSTEGTPRKPPSKETTPINAKRRIPLPLPDDLEDDSDEEDSDDDSDDYTETTTEPSRRR